MIIYIIGLIKVCYEFEPRYICGYWDGAYSTGSASVGVGWWLRAADN